MIVISASTTSFSPLPSRLDLDFLRRPRRVYPNPRRVSPVCASYAPTATATATATASLYDVLGLPAGASAPEIKAAYRKMARSCHPDVVAVDRKETSVDLFMRVHAAYSTLTDPNKRAEYDKELMLLACRRGLHRSSSFAPSSPSGPSSAFSTPAAAAASFSGFRRRTWETDQCW